MLMQVGGILLCCSRRWLANSDYIPSLLAADNITASFRYEIFLGQLACFTATSLILGMAT